MKERPIKFNAEMVRAILAGRKTQTRRIVKPQPIRPIQAASGNWFESDAEGVDAKRPLILKFGEIGDRLWCRETFLPVADFFGDLEVPKKFWYKADGDAWFSKWKPSIHMPRSASRITLEITNIRVERLQDISEEDAKAEGVVTGDAGPYWHDSKLLGHFRELWNSIHGESKLGEDFVLNEHGGVSAKSWEANPYVWVIEFKKLSEEK